MDIGFELAGYRNRYRTVSAKIQFRSTGFLAAQFPLVSSQLIGFQVNESQIRIYHPRKPMMTYLLFDHGVLLSTSTMLMNTTVRLVGHTDGRFLDGGPMLSEKEIARDLPLDERRVHAKFGCTGSYCVQMHKE
jgi:hypothetical protein